MDGAPMHMQELALRGEFGAVAAIEEVDEEAYGEPDEEGHPCEDFESHHEHDAEDDAEHREDGAERGTEGAVAFGLAVAKDENCDGDEDECEEGADVGEIRDGSDVEEAGGDADDESCDPGGDGRGAIALVDVAEDRGQQAIARHGKPDAGLAELEDEDRRDHAEHGADEDEEAHPMQAGAAGLEREALERVHHRGCVAHDGLPGNDAAEDDGHSTVKKRAGDESGKDADGKITLRAIALLGGGGDGVEPNIGEEDDGAAGKNAGESIGHEGMPVVRLDEAGRGKDEDKDGGDFNEDEDVVGAG